MTKKVAKDITENDMPIVMKYIITNNQYIAGLYRTLIQNNSDKFNQIMIYLFPKSGIKK